MSIRISKRILPKCKSILPLSPSVYLEVFLSIYLTGWFSISLVQPSLTLFMSWKHFPLHKQSNKNFTILFPAPPVPTSYYWYFLAINGNQISGSPPLLISGTYRLIDLGYFFNSRKSWVQTRITKEDCLLNPQACLSGLSIGFKIKLDKSIASCQEPRYLLDTGATSLMTRGVSVFVVGETLTVQITTAKNVYKVLTFIYPTASNLYGS